MDIPDAEAIITRMRNGDQSDSPVQQQEALGVLLLAIKSFHLKPQRPVISRDPNLAKAITQDINELNALAFATALDKNADLKQAAEHGAAALNRMLELATSSTHQAALDRLYQ